MARKKYIKKNKYGVPSSICQAFHTSKNPKKSAHFFSSMSNVLHP
jgi:hypothetical protein